MEQKTRRKDEVLPGLRWNRSIKSECIRPGVSLSLDGAERPAAQYVTVCNEQRLHSALDYVTPLARLQGRQAEIHASRDRQLEQARRQRELVARSQ